jgi:hypothetical protein
MLAQRVFDRSPRWPRSRAKRQLHQKLLIPVIAAIETGASVEEILALLKEMLLER